MRRFLSTCLLLFVAATLRADDTTEFFNGKDLNGWHGLKEYWSVVDGAIVGKHDGLKFNTFLCSDKMYGDFELSCKVRLLDAKGNSGFQIRSKVVDDKKWVVAGPQADIGAGYWGSLYGERFGGMMKASSKDNITKAVKDKDFNDYSIKVVGKHFTIKINGVTMIDEVFEKDGAKKEEVPAQGIIALQIHAGGPMEVTFKDIRFKNLSK